MAKQKVFNPFLTAGFNQNNYIPSEQQNALRAQEEDRLYEQYLASGAPQNSYVANENAGSAIGRGFTSGAAGVVQGQAELANLLGIGDGQTANYLKGVAERNARKKEYTIGDMIPFASDYWTNTEGAAYDVANMLGSSAAMLGETAALATGAGAVGGALGIGGAAAGGAAGVMGAAARGAGLAPKAVASLASKMATAARARGLTKLGNALDGPFGQLYALNILKTPIEVSSEAGSAGADALAEGADIEEARKRAGITAAIQMPLLALSNTLEASNLGNAFRKEATKALGKGTVMNKTTYANILSSITQEGLQNAWEEGMQQSSQEYAAGRQSLTGVVNPLQWSDEALQEAAVGGVGGAVLGVGNVGGRAAVGKGKEPILPSTVNPVFEGDEAEGTAAQAEAEPQGTVPETENAVGSTVEQQTQAAGITLKGAKEFLNERLDELPAGEEYNNITSLLETGDDQTVIDRAVQMGYGQQAATDAVNETIKEMNNPDEAVENAPAQQAEEAQTQVSAAEPQEIQSAENQQAESVDTADNWVEQEISGTFNNLLQKDKTVFSNADGSINWDKLNRSASGKAVLKSNEDIKNAVAAVNGDEAARKKMSRYGNKKKMILLHEAQRRIDAGDTNNNAPTQEQQVSITGNEKGVVNNARNQNINPQKQTNKSKINAEIPQSSQTVEAKTDNQGEGKNSKAEIAAAAETPAVSKAKTKPATAFKNALGDYVADPYSYDDANTRSYVHKSDVEKDEKQRVARITKTKDGKYSAIKGKSNVVLTPQTFDTLEQAEDYVLGKKAPVTKTVEKKVERKPKAEEVAEQEVEKAKKEATPKAEDPTEKKPAAPKAEAKNIKKKKEEPKAKVEEAPAPKETATEEAEALKVEKQVKGPDADGFMDAGDYVDSVMGEGFMANLFAGIEQMRKEKAEKKKAKAKAKKKSKADEALEADIAEDKLVEQVEKSNTVFDQIDAVIETIPGRERATVNRYFANHPEARYIIAERLDKGIELFVVRYNTKGKDISEYYVKVAGSDTAEKISKAEVTVMSKVAKVAIKETTKNAMSAEKKAKYVTEIPEDEDWEYADALEAGEIEGVKKGDKKAVNKIIDFLTIEFSENNPCPFDASCKTWGEWVRKAALKDAQYKDNYANDTIFDTDKISLDQKAYLDDYYQYLYDKYENKVENKSRNTKDLEEGLYGKEEIDASVKAFNEAMDKRLFSGSSDSVDEAARAVAQKTKSNAQNTETSEASIEPDQAFIDQLEDIFSGMKFKVSEKAPLDNFNPSLVAQMVNLGYNAVHQYKTNTVQAWNRFMNMAIERAKGMTDISKKFASHLLDSIWAILSNLPKSVSFAKEHLQDTLNKITTTLGIAKQGVEAGYSFRELSDMLRNGNPKAYNTIKDFLGAAYKAIEFYPRKVVESIKNINGGGNDVNVRTAQRDAARDSGRRNGNGLEADAGNNERGSQMGGSSTAQATNNQSGNQRPVPSASSQMVSGGGTATGRKQSNNQGRQKESVHQTGVPGNSDDRRSFGVSQNGGNGTAGSLDKDRSKAVVDAKEKARNASAQGISQLQFNKEPFKAADEKGIAKAVPILLPEQVKDEVAIERRFWNKNGKGMLVANGTGTGKTMVGLGQIVRFLQKGAKKILIVVPSSNIRDNWVNDGAKAGLPSSAFATITNGKVVDDAINIVTYASFDTNKNLLDENWDLVVMDESQWISSGAQSTETDRTNKAQTLRAIIGHEGTGYNDYLQSKYRKKYAEVKKLKSKLAAQRKALDKLVAEYGAVAAPVNAEVKGAGVYEGINALKAEIRKNDDRLKNLRRELDIIEKKERRKYDDRLAARNEDIRVLLMSATPFAYGGSIYYAEGLLFNYTGSYEDYMVDKLGYEYKEDGSVQIPRVFGVPAPNHIKEAAFHDDLVESGAMINRRLEVDQDYNRRFVKVDGGIGTKIDEGFKVLNDDYRKGDLNQIFRKRLDYSTMCRLLEAVKAEAAIPMIKEYLKQGKKVVLFHDYKSDEPIQHPFVLSKEELAELGDEAREEYKRFSKEHPELQQLSVDGSRNVDKILSDEFGESLVTINGDISYDKRSERVKQFNDDNSGVNIISVVSEAGKEGISLHDTTGVYPRVLINVGMPTRPTSSIQIEGRIYRLGQKSNAMLRYLYTDTAAEKKAFVDYISARTRTAETLALGDESRNLDGAFALGYLASQQEKGNFNAADDLVDYGGKLYDNMDKAELEAAMKEMYKAVNGDDSIDESIRAKVAERLQEMEDESNAEKRAEILTNKNEKQTIKNIQESVKGGKVTKVSDGVYMVEIAGGARNLWIDLNTSQASILGKMSDEQKQQVMSAADVKGSGFEIQGYYANEYRGEVGAVVDVIHLTEASKKNTLDHEIMHFVHNAILKTAEKKHLLSYFQYVLKKKIGDAAYNKLSQKEILARCEEMEADAYAAFCEEERRPKNLVERIFWKMQKWLAQFAEKFGVETPMGIYMRVRSGKMYAERLGDKNVQSVYSKKEAPKFEVSRDKLSKFINTALNNPKESLRLILGKVSDAEASAIQKATGLNVAGFAHIWLSEDVRHIQNRHGVDTEGVDGQKGLTQSDILEALNVIKEPDEIKKGSTTKSGEPSIRFLKSEKDGQYTIVEVVRAKNKHLAIKTMWKKTADNKKEAATTKRHADNISPQYTSETGSGKTASVRNANGVSAFNENISSKADTVKDLKADSFDGRENSIESIEQQDGTIKFKINPLNEVNGKKLPDDVSATINDANALADERGDGEGEIVVKDTSMTAKEKNNTISFFDAVLTSPSHLAKKNPVFRSFYEIYQKAERLQEKLRSRWQKQFQQSVGMLSNQEEMDNFLDLMVAGELEKKEYSIAELKERGYTGNVVQAYSRIRQLIRNVWKEVNDTHRGLVYRKEVLSAEALSKLAKKPFIENIMVHERLADTVNNAPLKPLSSIKLKEKAVYEVQYAEPHIYKTQEQLTQEQLDELKINPYAHIVKAEKANIEGIELYNATVQRVAPPIGKITGYLPHIFEQWMVLVETKEGSVPVGSGQSLNDALKVAEQLKEHTNGNVSFYIAPKLFNPSQVLGGDEATTPSQSSVKLTTEEFARLEKAMSKTFSVTPEQARAVLKGTVSKASRSRFFGNLRQRKGRAGYNSDVIDSLSRYISMSSRYCALQRAKIKAINLFERTFGNIDKDFSGADSMAVAVRRYIRYCNGTPNYLEKWLTSQLNKWDWWNQHVRSKYGDRTLMALAGKINGILSTSLLGYFNISSAVIGLTQLVNTYGLIGGKYLGKGMEAAKRMNIRDKRVLAEVGVLNDISLDTVSGFTKRRKAIDGLNSIKGMHHLLSSLGDKGMYFFKQADTITRCVSSLGAYYEAVDKGMSHAGAIAYAREVNRKANFNYGAADAPSIFQHTSGTGFGELMLLFQKYPIKEFELMRSLMPFIGSGTKAQKARFWSAYMLMAGMAGIPAGDWIDEMLESWVGFKPSTALKSIMFRELGDTPVTRTIAYGVFSNLGIDISRRVGMANLVPDDPSIASFILGPGFNIAQRIHTSLAGGEPVKAIKAINPAIGNFAEAVVQGYHTNSKGQITYKYDGLETFFKAMGFRPVGESIDTDLQSAVYMDRTRAKDKRQKLLYDIAYKEAHEGYKPTREDYKLLRENNITGTQYRKAVKEMRMTAKERMRKRLTKQQRKDFAGTLITEDNA